MNELASSRGLPELRKLLARRPLALRPWTLVALLLLLCLSLYLRLTKSPEMQVRDVPREVEDEARLELWLETMPLPPVAVATSKVLPRGACGRQLRRYLEDLRAGILWATQMFDASVKHPHGVVDGQTRHFGSFDQCYRIKAKLPSGREDVGCTEDVHGKYCLVDFKYARRNRIDVARGKLDLEFDPNDSVWEAIEEKGDFRRVRRYMLQLGLCVPAACSAEEVQRSLQSSYDDYGARYNVTIDVGVDKKNCQTYADQPDFSVAAVVYCFFVICLLALISLGSLSDDASLTEDDIEKSSIGAQILLCFSARRNVRAIFQVKYKHRGLDVIYMFRFLGTCLVIFGHRGLVYYLNPVVNERHFEMTFDIPSFIMLYNGPILVDGFLAIGGLLTCYTFLQQIEKTRRINFLAFVFFRFVRLTPVYTLLLFFNAHVFRHVGSGPQWESIVGAEADNCASAWWAHLLYLNNYMTMDRICMFQSWYLAVDFHCYVFAFFLICEFCRRPRKDGYKLLAAVTLLSILVPFFVTLAYRVRPLLIVYPKITSLSMDSYFRNYYVKTHLRMTAYLVGIIAGAILHDYEKVTWRIPEKLTKLLFVFLYVIMTHTMQALGYPYLNPNSNTSSMAMALYASLHRGVYAAGVCSLVLLVAMGDGLDAQYNALAAGWAQPLGRLTYSAFLSHNLIQAYQAATARTARTFSAHNLIWNFVPDVVFSFSLALVIAVCVECPFRNLEKLAVSMCRSKKIGIYEYQRKSDD